MQRCLEAELLDELAPADSRAVGSRRDLQRLNSWMGNARILASSLGEPVGAQMPRRILELGAGDGTFLLRVCQGLHARGNALPEARRAGTRTVILLDRQPIVSSDTRTNFEKLGWSVETVEMDVFEWLRRPAAFVADAIVANLVLHHFSDEQLSELFRLAATRTRIFAAVEPRRCGIGLFCSRMLWAVGCNDVTRHDAPASVRAGFSGSELSHLWPKSGDWVCAERRAGWCSHSFIARRTMPSPDAGQA